MSIVPHGKKTAAGVDNTARRTWDKDEFRAKAEEKAKVGAVTCTACIVELLLQLFNCACVPSVMPATCAHATHAMRRSP